MSGEFISSVDVVEVLRKRLTEDEKFISDHHGYCREYPQNARVEFVGELLEKYLHWQDKAESWDYLEDYCNERAQFLNDLLLLIARNWEVLHRMTDPAVPLPTERWRRSCWNCGAKLMPPGATACRACGAKQDVPTQPVFCGACGDPLTDSECSHCGATYGSKSRARTHSTDDGR